jgi:ABC-type uncharacterized transport system fused permease/ATPase subunit
VELKSLRHPSIIKESFVDHFALMVSPPKQGASLACIDKQLRSASPIVQAKTLQDGRVTSDTTVRVENLSLKVSFLSLLLGSRTGWMGGHVWLALAHVTMCSHERKPCVHATYREYTVQPANHGVVCGPSQITVNESSKAFPTVGDVALAPFTIKCSGPKKTRTFTALEDVSTVGTRLFLGDRVCPRSGGHCRAHLNTGGVQAFEDGSVKRQVLEPGKMYLVLGPPKSGKTTLLKAISGEWRRTGTDDRAACSSLVPRALTPASDGRAAAGTTWGGAGWAGHL